jgi:hypothetical protein
MKAKKKPIASVTPQELGVEVAQQLATLKVGGQAAGWLAELVLCMWWMCMLCCHRERCATVGLPCLLACLLGNCLLLPCLQVVYTLQCPRAGLLLFSALLAAAVRLCCAAPCQVEEPAKRKAGVVLGSVAELVEKLHKEAKVI